MFNQLFVIDDDVSYQNSLRCASPLLLARTNMYKVLHNAAVPSTDLNSLFFLSVATTCRNSWKPKVDVQSSHDTRDG